MSQWPHAPDLFTPHRLLKMGSCFIFSKQHVGYTLPVYLIWERNKSRNRPLFDVFFFAGHQIGIDPVRV